VSTENDLLDYIADVCYFSEGLDRKSQHGELHHSFAGGLRSPDLARGGETSFCAGVRFLPQFTLEILASL
jgi:hypothetical protein